MTTEKRGGGCAVEAADAKRAKKVQTSLVAHFAKVKSSGIGSSELGSAPDHHNSESRPVGDEMAETDATPTVLSPSSQPPKETSGDAEEVAVQSVGQDFTPEERELLALELSQLPVDWLKYLGPELNKPYFKLLKEFLRKEKSRGCKVFPPEPSIYAWARLCPFRSVKVVIIGQDPYHNDNQAMGLCFSVPLRERIPPSLINIYKELSTDVAGFKTPSHGDLSHWAQQGVLLLNTSLTVRAHEPASHAGHGWEQFTDAVIRAVNAHKQHVVFILWGNHAQKKSPMISRSKHLVLTGIHPSPLSAARGFFGCKHFSKTNEYLQKHNMKTIDWNLPQ